MESGTRLGPYEIVSRIGAGGMGEVWRARDTRLGRDVAIKILPAEFASDAKLKIRFEREAKTISQLTHPNICTLFDVGENYLVMELLEGESLADRLHRGPLPLSDVARCGAEIAEALDKGHQSGIVHRDLKPANVMLTKSGAKLLDFGLAKSSVIDLNADAEGATVQKPLTAQGTIIGTFQYMAPEQLEGAEADPRTDIFALGAVLYEMATGQRAFEGKTKTSLIAAIVNGEPRPIREMQPLTPAALEHVIAKCLQKDPARRWQSAADVAEELRWIGQSGSGVAKFVGGKRRLPASLPWILAGVLLLCAAAASVFLWSRTRPSRSLDVTISMEPTGGLDAFSGVPALSPDGKSVAFAARNESGEHVLWVRSLDNPTPRELPHTEEANSPFWSPDGSRIAFFARGLLRVTSATGGEPDVLAATGSWRSGGSWSRSGVIVYAIGGGYPIFKIPESGGTPVPLIEPRDIGAQAIMWPSFLPDGKHFLFLAKGAALDKDKRSGTWVGSTDRGEKPRFVTRTSANAFYVEPGWLLYCGEQSLRAQRFDDRTFQVSGDSIAIAPMDYWGWSSAALFSGSNDGTIVYGDPADLAESDLVIKTRQGELRRTLIRGRLWTPRVSRDGRFVAVMDGSSASLWLVSMSDGAKSRFTFDPVVSQVPAWSPGDREIAYMRGPWQNLSIAIKGMNTAPRTLLNLPNTSEAPCDWSPDGTLLAFTRWDHTRPDRDLLLYSFVTHQVTEIASTLAHEGGAVFSPDGKWIAYESDETRRLEIYVEPVPQTGVKYQVSTTGGHWPRWPTQDEIVFADTTNHFASAKVDTRSGFTSAPPQSYPLELSHHGLLAWPEYDVLEDGTVLVNDIDYDHPAPLKLITNWTSRVRTHAK